MKLFIFTCCRAQFVHQGVRCLQTFLFDFHLGSRDSGTVMHWILDVPVDAKSPFRHSSWYFFSVLFSQFMACEMNFGWERKVGEKGWEEICSCRLLILLFYVCVDRKMRVALRLWILFGMPNSEIKTRTRFQKFRMHTHSRLTAFRAPIEPGAAFRIKVIFISCYFVLRTYRKGEFFTLKIVLLGYLSQF